MRLLIVRHGECLGQCEPGNDDPDSPLSPLGVRQSLLTARRLAGERVTHVLSSPLIRSLATASTIAQELGGFRVEVWTELREGFSKKHRGLARVELLERFPSALLPSTIGSDGWEHGGDTPASFSVRCKHTVTLLKERFGSSDTVVIVTHGGFANYFFHALLHMPAASPHWFEMGNCAISIARLVPVEERECWPLYPPFEVEVLNLNDMAHLSSLL